MALPMDTEDLIMSIEAAFTVDEVKDFLRQAPENVKDDMNFAKQVVLQGPWVVRFLSDRLKSNYEFACFAINRNPASLPNFNDEIKKNMAYLLSFVCGCPNVILHIDKAITNNPNNLTMFLNTNVEIFAYLNDQLKSNVELMRHVITMQEGTKQFKYGGPEVRKDPIIVNYIADHDLLELRHALWFSKEILMRFLDHSWGMKQEEQEYFILGLPTELIADKEVAMKAINCNSSLYDCFPLSTRNDIDVIVNTCERWPAVMREIPARIINDPRFITKVFEKFGNNANEQALRELKSRPCIFPYENQDFVFNLAKKHSNAVMFLTEENQIENQDLLIESIREHGLIFPQLCMQLQLNVDFICRAMDSQPLFHMWFLSPSLLNHPKTAMRFVRRRTLTYLCLDDNLKLDEGVCMEAVKIHGATLKHIPKSARTREIVLTAIKNDACSLKHAGNFLNDPIIVATALKKNPLAAQFVKGSLKDNRKFLKAFSSIIDPTKLASARLLKAGIDYIMFDDRLLNHTQYYIPPEIQRHVLRWLN